MNINELEILANAVNNNEDVLENKANSLRDEVRDWCIEEMRKIEAEEKKLLDFVNKNRMCFMDKCGTPYFYSYGMFYGREYIGNLQYDVNFKKLGLLDKKGKMDGFEDFDVYWQQASVHNWTTRVQGCAFPMTQNIEYWTRMKRCIDFRWWQLDKMCEKCKQILRDNIDKQKKRMDGVVKVCKEIDDARKNNEPCVEVTISIYK